MSDIRSKSYTKYLMGGMVLAGVAYYLLPKIKRRFINIENKKSCLQQNATKVKSQTTPRPPEPIHQNQEVEIQPKNLEESECISEQDLDRTHCHPNIEEDYLEEELQLNIVEEESEKVQEMCLELGLRSEDHHSPHVEFVNKSSSLETAHQNQLREQVYTTSALSPTSAEEKSLAIHGFSVSSVENDTTNNNSKSELPTQHLEITSPIVQLVMMEEANSNNSVNVTIRNADSDNDKVD